VADQWYSEVERYDFKKHSGPKTGTDYRDTGSIF